MIENGKLDGLRGAYELACRPAVGAAGPSIPAWVIVRQNNSGAPISGGINHDFTDRYLNRIRPSFVVLDVKATG